MVQRLIDLTAQAMIGVSQQWLTVDRATIEAEPTLNAGLKFIEEAHERLVTTQRQAGLVEQQVAELTAALTEADASHDRMARGIYSALSAWSDLVAAAEAQTYEGVQNALFPIGLSITQRTYREQAGAAVQVRKQLTPEVMAILGKVRFGDLTLAGAVEAWLDTADRIGTLHAERARISGDTNEGAVRQGDVRNARLQWIRATNAFLTLLDFTNLDADTRRRLLADLRDAEARARRRNSQPPANGGDNGSGNVDADAGTELEPHLH